MAKPGEPDLVALTKDLLDAIEDKNLPRYRELVDESITCFEPEAAGYLVEGIAFHEYYFQWDRRDGARVQTTLVRPHQRMLGPDAAVVSYVRLTQFDDADSGAPKTRYSEETRVWERKDGQWRNVHFHRSVPE